MEHLNRLNNRPSPAGGQIPGVSPVNGGNGNNKSSNSPVKIVLIVTLIVISIVTVLALLGFAYKNTIGATSQINKDKFQAVFLNSSDGQVYFGKLKDLDKEYYELTDIYYVRVEQVQPNPNEQPQQNISLAKLGNEIHGPEDFMYIRKDHVMFWENLKDDGQVVKAINDYKKNGSTSTNNQQNSQNNNNQENQNSNQ
jgi:hypothetical protein